MAATSGTRTIMTKARYGKARNAYPTLPFHIARPSSRILVMATSPGSDEHPDSGYAQRAFGAAGTVSGPDGRPARGRACRGHYLRFSISLAFSSHSAEAASTVMSPLQAAWRISAHLARTSLKLGAV